MAENLPEYKRTESLESFSVPDFGGAFREYGAASNSLSAIGAKVAQSAAQAQAVQRGYQAGLDPKGDALPPITEFDKTFVDSYHQQAQATLGLQAQQLLNDADIQLAQASRITPGLIQDTNDQVAQGLEGILKNAPSAIRGNLEYNFASAMQQQTHQYQNKMIKQQRDDQRSIIMSSFAQNAKQIYEYAATGNEEAAKRLVDQTKGLGQSGVGTNVIDRTESANAYDTARQSYLNGKAVYEATKAQQEKRLEKHLKDFSETDPKKLGMTTQEKDVAGQAVMNHFAVLNNLRSQDSQLRMAHFNNVLAKNPYDVGIPEMLQDLKRNLSPIDYEKTEFNYIQAMKGANKNQADMAAVAAAWNDPAAFSRLPEKAINSGYDVLVDKLMKDKNLSRDDAEVQVAASAGGIVPVFRKTIENKLKSGNPEQIQSANNQIKQLRDMQALRALDGLDKKSEAIGLQFNRLSASMPATDAARQATDNIMNTDSDKIKALDDMWALQMNKDISSGTGRTKSINDWALSKVGIDKGSFLNPSMEFIYATDIYNQLKSNFEASNGDWDVAIQMTKNFVDAAYGETLVNGQKHFTEHPIEKVLGYQSSDVVPFIHQDVADQLTKRFEAASTKDTFWKVKPVDTKPINKSFFRTEYPPMEVEYHTMGKDGKPGKSETYQVVLVGGPSDGWDIALNTKSGMRNLFQVAPYLGVVKYVPNSESIKKQYMDAHGFNAPKVQKLPFKVEDKPVVSGVEKPAPGMVAKQPNKPENNKRPFNMDVNKNIVDK